MELIIPCSLCKKEQPFYYFRNHSKQCVYCLNIKNKNCSIINNRIYKKMFPAEYDKINGEYKRSQKNRRKAFNNVRKRITDFLKDAKRPTSISKSIGCSHEFLRQYLESKFQPGMTWENYGFRGWHIDHIIPISSFDLTDKTQLEKACHYTNLQPLWAADNIKKGNKIYAPVV